MTVRVMMGDGRASYEDLGGWLSEALGKIAILEEQREAVYKQMDEILIRRNNRIAELEAEKLKWLKVAEWRGQAMQCYEGWIEEQGVLPEHVLSKYGMEKGEE